MEPPPGSSASARDASLKNAAYNQTLLSVPEGVTLNYLIRRRTPSPFLNFMPPEFAIYGEDAMIHALQTSPPDRVLFVPKPSAVYGMEFGRDYGARLMAWIEENYSEIGEFEGGEVFRCRSSSAFWHPRPGTETVRGAGVSRIRPCRPKQVHQLDQEPGGEAQAGERRRAVAEHEELQVHPGPRAERRAHRRTAQCRMAIRVALRPQNQGGRHQEHRVVEVGVGIDDEYGQQRHRKKARKGPRSLLGGTMRAWSLRAVATPARATPQARADPTPTCGRVTGWPRKGWSASTAGWRP